MNNSELSGNGSERIYDLDMSSLLLLVKSSVYDGTYSGVQLQELSLYHQRANGLARDL